MLIALLFACTAEPPPPPEPEPQQPKPRVPITSMVSKEVQEAVQEEGKPEEVDPGPSCDIDIDLSKAPIDKDFKIDGVEGSWGRIEIEPYVLRDPSRHCPILAPAKLTLIPPADLGCTKVTLSVNTGCSGPCSHARSEKDGKQVAIWESGLEKKAEVELSGEMDKVEFWSEGGEICRVHFQ